MSRQINQDFVERQRLRERRSQLELINPLREHLEREKRRKIERATKALSRPLNFPKPVETSELERANLAKAAFVTHNSKHLTEEAFLKGVAYDWTRALNTWDEANIARKKAGLEPKPTVWQGYQPAKSDWARVNRERRAFEEQSFDPFPEWWRYQQKREEKSWYKNWRYDDKWVYRPFENHSYKDWQREEKPFEDDPTKRSIGGGYTKTGARFTVNERGEVIPEGCEFGEDYDDNDRWAVGRWKRLRPANDK